MAERDQLLQTVEAIHDAGLEPKHWPDALAAIMRSVGGIAATLEVFDRRTATLTEFHAFDIPSRNEIAYSDYYFARNPRVPLLINGTPGGIITDYMVLDEKGMGGNEFYADFLGQTGFRYFVGGTMSVSDRESVLFSVQRATGQGHVDSPEVTRMRQLLPHVRQAFEVTRRLRQAGEREESLTAAFDRLADGIALVGRDGRILHANEAFESIARQDDGIAIGRQRLLEFSCQAARRKFDKAIAAACRVRHGEIRPTHSMEFPIHRSSKSPPYVVSVAPVFGRGHKAMRDQHAQAIVFVRDPLRQNRSGIKLLRAVFGLTEAEAHVAQALQAAVPLADYASAQGVSINTVYTHLRQIKQKTGCSRQGELIRRLNDILMPLRGD